MNDPHTQQSELRELRNEMYEKDAVIKQVKEITEALEKKDISEWMADDLSRAAMKLSVLLVNLGEKVADAESVANISYIYRKWKKAGQISEMTKKTDKSITFAKETVEEKIGDELESEMDARYFADSLRGLYDDTERLVSVIQTRLRVLTNEELRSRTT